MKLIALLYILTGISLIVLYMMFTGAMLGISTPVSLAESLLLGALWALAPALLIVGGIATATKPPNRLRWSIVSGAALVAALALWTIPRIGGPYSLALFIGPCTIAFGIGIPLAGLLKRAWLVTFIGGLIASPLFYGVVELVRGPGMLTLAALWILIPASFLLASLAFALSFRTP